MLFIAQVHREPLHAKTIVSHAAPVVHKVVSTPIIAKVATPVVHHAAPIIHSAPCKYKFKKVKSHYLWFTFFLKTIHMNMILKTVVKSAVVHHHQPAYYHH